MLVLVENMIWFGTEIGKHFSKINLMLIISELNDKCHQLFENICLNGQLKCLVCEKNKIKNQAMLDFLFRLIFP
jgi:hypothetical protein